MNSASGDITMDGGLCAESGDGGNVHVATGSGRSSGASTIRAGQSAGGQGGHGKIAAGDGAHTGGNVCICGGDATCGTGGDMSVSSGSSGGAGSGDPTPPWRK